MPGISLEPVPFEAAIESFKKKVPLTPEQFHALAEEMKGKAFTVSGVARMDILLDIHGAVEKAIAAGETLTAFKNRIDEIIETRGWEVLSPWRLETIFRTNIQTAYSVGRHRQMIEEKEAFPFWEYSAVNDSRSRPTHAALDGKVFPADHPFWDTWYPPNGYNCRCSVNPVHKYAAEAEDLKIETRDPTGELIEPIDPVTGNKMPARPLLPDPGFARNPAKEVWEPDFSKYPASLRKLFEKERK